MDDETPTTPLNIPTSSNEDPGQVWLVSYSDDDDRELTVKEISRALERGEISPSTIVWRDGMPDWKPISGVDELKSALRGRASKPIRKRQTVIGGFNANTNKSLAPSGMRGTKPGLAPPPVAPSPARGLGRNEQPGRGTAKQGALGGAANKSGLGSKSSPFAKASAAPRPRIPIADGTPKGSLPARPKLPDTSKSGLNKPTRKTLLGTGSLRSALSPSGSATSSGSGLQA